MAGFPIAWDYEANGDNAPDQRGPYSAQEMQQYLFSNHYHWSTNEPPLELSSPRYAAELAARDRHLWLWVMSDQTGRNWNLYVGSGRSPFFNDDRHCHRFMYASEDEGEEPAMALQRQARYLAE